MRRPGGKGGRFERALRRMAQAAVVAVVVVVFAIVVVIVIALVAVIVVVVVVVSTGVRAMCLAKVRLGCRWVPACWWEAERGVLGRRREDGGREARSSG